MHAPFIYLTSIISGFCMMALEIMGGRYLYPDFGSSVDVWAAIITVFILSLSVGYWLGGRIADRAKTNKPLGWILVAAGIFFLLLPIYARPFANALGPSIHQARAGSLLAGVFLFLPPSLLLGCVSPMLVKLIFTTAHRVGRAAGTLFAIGNVGSVLGILVADYVLLTYFSLNTNVIGMGIVLALTGLVHLSTTLTATRPIEGAEPAAAAVIGEGA